MNIEKQKLEEELKNIKEGIYDKYYHNIFKRLSEHTFERKDAKRILQIENYKVTECYIGFKNAVNEYDMENYQEYMKKICQVYNKSTMENLKNNIVRIVFHYNLMIFLLGTVIFKTQELYLTVSNDIFDFKNIK